MNDFASFWQTQAAQAAAPREVHMQREALHNPLAEYYTLSYPGGDGHAIRARYLRPTSAQTAPTLLYFHDYTCPVRGWHHMTRFIAAGYAVIAMENRACGSIACGWQDAPGGLAYAQLFTDALITAHVARALPGTGALCAFGEGLGGGLALSCAAMLGEWMTLCACHNPLPADIASIARSGADTDFYAGIRRHFRCDDPLHEREDAFLGALSYIDLVHFAPLVRCPVLMGTSMMDAITPPAAQDAVYDALTCEKRRLLYAKHIHERINDFEDELLRFLHKPFE